MLSSKKRTQFADDVSNGFTQATNTLFYTNHGWLAANPGQIFGGRGDRPSLFKHRPQVFTRTRRMTQVNQPALKEIF